LTSLRRIAYGKPKAIKGWPIVDRTTDIGISMFQILRARPYAFGYKAGRKYK
jgi:hypothetical protein